MTEQPAVKCPECGAQMRQTRRGATLKRRGPAYVCPASEALTLKNEHGHLYRVKDGKHGWLRIWLGYELPESHS